MKKCLRKKIKCFLVTSKCGYSFSQLIFLFHFILSVKILKIEWFSWIYIESMVIRCMTKIFLYLGDMECVPTRETFIPLRVVLTTVQARDIRTKIYFCWFLSRENIVFISVKNACQKWVLVDTYRNSWKSARHTSSKIIKYSGEVDHMGSNWIIEMYKTISLFYNRILHNFSG